MTQDAIDSPAATSAKLVADYMSGALTAEKFLAALTNLVFELGLPALLFQEYLTAEAIRRGEDIADIVEAAKLSARRMRGEPT